QSRPLVLLHGKRGSIGSTLAPNPAAYLAAAAPLAADATTVSPYLGLGSLEPALKQARSTGRGVFVLARTSNPEGGTVQCSRGADGVTVAQSGVDSVAEWNRGAEPLGAVGVVVGATVKPGDLRLGAVSGPVLAPGLGARGATAEDLRRVFGEGVRAVLPSSSRDILRHGPTPEALRSAVEAARE